MKMYKGIVVEDYSVFNFVSRLKWVVSFRLQPIYRQAKDRWLGRRQSKSELCDGERNLSLCRNLLAELSYLTATNSVNYKYDKNRQPHTQLS
jgi:hypothetical protein